MITITDRNLVFFQKWKFEDFRKLYVTKSGFLIDVNVLDTIQDFINFFFRQVLFWLMSEAHKLSAFSVLLKPPSEGHF